MSCCNSRNRSVSLSNEAFEFVAVTVKFLASLNTKNVIKEARNFTVTATNSKASLDRLTDLFLELQQLIAHFEGVDPMTLQDPEKMKIHLTHFKELAEKLA